MHVAYSVLRIKDAVYLRTPRNTRNYSCALCTKMVTHSASLIALTGASFEDTQGWLHKTERLPAVKQLLLLPLPAG